MAPFFITFTLNGSNDLALRKTCLLRGTSE